VICATLVSHRIEYWKNLAWSQDCFDTFVHLRNQSSAVFVVVFCEGGNLLRGRWATIKQPLPNSVVRIDFFTIAQETTSLSAIRSFVAVLAAHQSNRIQQTCSSMELI
jgi:hypothetical protein